MKPKKRKKRNFIREFPILSSLFGALLLCIIALIFLLSPSSSMQENIRIKLHLPKANMYREDAFYVEDGFLRYANAQHMIGIDVSEHQENIDWQTLADSGVEFAILRLGYRGSTVGELYVDEEFYTNLHGARAVGISVGVYFFSQALNVDEACEEAEFVCEVLAEEDLELPVFYDWEFIGGRIPSESSVPLTECAIAFCDAVQAQGHRAGVYFNQTYGTSYFDLFALRNYVLWLAEYDTTPDFPYHFDILQYTDSGELDGIEGNVDFDIYFP